MPQIGGGCGIGGGRIGGGCGIGGCGICLLHSEASAGESVWRVQRKPELEALMSPASGRRGEERMVSWGVRLLKMLGLCNSPVEALPIARNCRA